MAKLVLHIGTHKTGTTAIQRALDCNRRLLHRQGVIYPWFPAAKPRPGSTAKRLWTGGRNRLAQLGLMSPVIGSFVGHHGLLSPWVNLPDTLLPAAPPEILLQKLSKAHANSARTVLLSSEEFSRAWGGHNGKGPDLARIREMVAGFPEIQIVCFLRDQISFLQSLYLEVSNNFVPPGPEKLCAQAIKSGYGAGMFMDFNLLQDRLRAAFPSDQLSFIDYAQAAQSPEGVTGTLLATTGHGQMADRLLLPGNGRANVSQPPLAVWVANQITDTNLPRNHLLGIAKDTLRDHFGPGAATSIFTRNERNRMAAHFEPLNRTFEARVAAADPGAGARFQLSAPAGRDMVCREDLGPPFWGDLTRAVRQEAS